MMRENRQVHLNLSPNAELLRLLAEAKHRTVDEAELHEQRISFAFGTRPRSPLITQEPVRVASGRLRLQR